MSFGLIDVLRLIGALGFFIFGMKIMSEGIQKAAGNSLRKILSAMTSTRFLGLGTGFLITCLIQSSSATTVMVVSFVNAGLLSLTESIGVIMGANIGTTLTGWLVSLFGFKFKIASFALPILAIGFPLIFMNKNKLKSWGEFIIGFALLFMGLDELKNAVPDLKSDPQAVAFIAEYANMGVLSTIIFVSIGTLLTIIVQSSSAAMAITLVLCNQGVITLDVAAAIVLGENIGTTITANIAALVANIHAKRAAIAHLIFNVFGVVWVIIFFDPFLSLVEATWVPFQNMLKSIKPDFGNDAIEMQLSLFHSLFNIFNSFLLIWFVNRIAKIVIKIIPSKGVEETHHLAYISSGIISTPEIALIEAQKEILRFGKLTQKMGLNVKKLLTETDKKKSSELYEKIKQHEEITDRIEVEVATYLAKISEGEISDDSSVQIRGMLSIVGDLERIGDIYYQMSKTIERKVKEKVWFTPEQRTNILELFTIVEEAQANMIKNLEKDDVNQVSLSKAKEIELRINALRKKLRKGHFKSVEQGEYNFKSATVYSNLFNSLEKIGDHVINVSEGLVADFEDFDEENETE